MGPAGPATDVSRTGKTGRAPGRLTNGLVALGAAAVLAIYSAGYVGTRAAASRLEEPGPRRRPAPPPPVQEVLPALSVEPPKALPEGAAPALAPRPDAAVLAPAPGQIDRPTSAAAPPPAKVPAPAEHPVAQLTQPATASKLASAPSDDGGGAVTPGPATIAVPARDEPAAPAVAAAAAPPAEPTQATQPASAESSPTPAVQTNEVPKAPDQVAAVVPAAPKYKDGTYSGWGTCRHGDIQATVVIASGRITSASISQCWTRYPCSWIAALPPQVVQRQSADVDYVSGATQSANAFYYAILEALGKAK